jgi:hypothetical protein
VFGKIIYPMKVIPVFFYILITINYGYGQSQIPQVINTTGNSSQNKGYSVQWSIGELALINEMDAADGSHIFTNGFIQPIDGLTLPLLQKPLSSAKIEFSSANVRIFPNPTHDNLEIEFSKSISGKVSVQLFNELGRIVYTHSASKYGIGSIEKINMKNFTKGIYILYIKGLNPVSGRYDLEIGSYKIIKL